MRVLLPYLATPLLAATLARGSAAVSPASRTFDLQEKDAGRTVQVRIGDTVRVQLVESFPVPGSSLVWDVTSDGPSVLAGVSMRRPRCFASAADQIQESSDSRESLR
jgi:hypothetical protein